MIFYNAEVTTTPSNKKFEVGIFTADHESPYALAYRRAFLAAPEGETVKKVEYWRIK